MSRMARDLLYVPQLNERLWHICLLASGLNEEYYLRQDGARLRQAHFPK